MPKIARQHATHVGTRRPSGDQCELGRREGIHQLAFAEERANLPASLRSRMGICRAGRDDNGILVGTGRRLAPSQLPGMQHGLGPANISGWFIQSECVRPLRYCGQRRGVGGRLLERQFPRRSERRLGMDCRNVPAAGIARRRLRQPGQIRAFHGAFPLRFGRQISRKRVSRGAGVALEFSFGVASSKLGCRL